MDRFTKIVLAVIAANLTIGSAKIVFEAIAPRANAQGVVQVHVQGGRLDYETDVSGGPTLKVCTTC